MRRTSQPEIEFVVPVFKSAPYVEETLRSLLSQEGLRSSITLRIAEAPEFKLSPELRSKIRILHAPTGQGIGSDWTAALLSARTPIVTLAHSDDLYEPEYAETVLNAFHQFPEAGVAFCENIYIGQTRRLSFLLGVKKLFNPGKFARKPVLISAQRMERALKFGPFIPCPTVAYNLPQIQSALHATPLFDPLLKTALDWKAWLTLARNGLPFIYIPRPLVQLRVHGSATTQTTIQSGARTQELYDILYELWGKTVADQFIRFFIFGNGFHKI